MAVAAKPLDAAIAERVIAAVTPLTIETRYQGFDEPERARPGQLDVDTQGATRHCAATARAHHRHRRRAGVKSSQAV